MVEEKVVQRDDDDPPREGREVVEEEPVAQLKKEPKKTGKVKRKSSAKKSGEQGTDTDAGLRNKHPDRGSVIELLEKNALKAAFGPGNKDEMEDCYPILISFMRNLTDEQWQVIYKGFKKPMTKEQLAKLCKTIVNFIAQTTLQILLPALARILGVTGFYDNADSLKRGGSARSFTAFEQKRLELIQEVKYLAKEMCNCGGRALRPRSSTPSSKSSQTSLKAHLGMPEDSIISSVQEQLSKSDQMVAAGQLSQIDKVVGTMLENIEKISSEFGEELVYQESLRSSSSLSFSTAKSQKTEWEFALPGTPIPSELPESTAQPIVRCSVIDMSESSKPKTMVCDARTSMFAIADTIMKKVYPEAEGQVTSHPDLTDAIARLEELISQGKIGALSRDLSHQVNRIISDSNLTPLGLTVAAGKSASDTILSKLKRNDKVGKPTTYELVQLFVEESVKCLLLPSFVPYSTSMSLAQGAKVLARVSEDRISCSSSSSVFSDTVSLFTKVMVSQVMYSVDSDAESIGSSPTESLQTSETTISDVGNLLSDKSSPRLSPSGTIMATSETSNAAQILKANIDGEEVDTTSHSGVAQNIVRDDMSTSPDMVKDVTLPTPSSDNLGGDDDVTDLISMLVMRILTEIQTPAEDYPVDVTRKSQDLIPKVMEVFCAWSGCSETQAYPENLRIDKVYRVVYKNLLEEFGSEKILQQAVSTQDSSFDRILVKSLSEVLLHRCNEALRAASRTSVKTTGPKALPLAEDVRASSGKLSFLQRLVRLTSNLKLFKKGNKKDSHRSESEQVQTTAEDGMLPSIVPHAAMSALPKDLPASSQQETPHKRPLLVRMFSAISKGLFKPFKQSLKTK